MKRRFTILTAALALLVSLAIPMGMWGQTYSLTPDATSTGLTNTSYITSLTEFTYSDVSWKMNQWNPSNLQVKTNQGTPESEFRFYNTSAIPGRITKVVLKFQSLTLTNTSNTGFMFVGGTSEVSTTTGGTSGTWNSSAKTITWIPGASDYFTYFGFYQNGKVATGTNKLATADAIVITYETSGSNTPTMSVSTNSIDFGSNTINPANPYTRTFDVTFANLTENLTVTGFSGVSVTPATINANATSPQTVTATYNPTTAGSISGNISVNSSEVDEQLVAVSGSAYDPANVDTYELYTGEIVEGDYVIYNTHGAMKNELNGGPRFNNESVTISGDDNDVIINPANSVIWHIAPIENTEYWTIYNADINKYAGGTTSKNQGALYDDYTDNHAKWKIYYSYSTLYIENLGRSQDASDSGNKYLRQNTTASAGWATYANSGSYVPKLYKKVITNQVAAPTFSVVSGTYYETKTVELSCETSGATIYYTTNGTTPSASNGIEYTTSISVSNTMTIKAIAVKEGMTDSDVATAEYTIEQPYSTIPALFAAATATEQDVRVTFGNWVVSGVSTNGKSVYVTDNSGNGFIIYFTSDMSGTFAAGDILSGTAVACKLKLYNGAAELVNLTATDLTITSGGTVSISNIPMSDLSGVNTGALVSYNNLICSVSDNKYYLTDGTTTLQVYNTLYAFNEFEAGKTYNITGVYVQYNSIKEIAPRSTDDIEEVQVQHNEYTLTVGNLVHVTTYVFDASDQSETLLVGAGQVDIYDGTEVMISLDVEEGYVIESLIVGGVDVTSQIDADAYTFTMPTNAVTVTATAVEDVPPTPGNYVRINSLNQLTDGSKVIIAARHNATADSYYAMQNATSGKPEGTLFTSVTSGNDEVVASTITDDEDNYYWTVNVTENGYTFTNASDQMIGYGSSTNFATGNNTEWTIERGEADDNTMVPGYEGFVIKNGTTTTRAFAFNGSAFGAYATTNMNAAGYNFFLDFFVQTSAPVTETYTLDIEGYGDTQNPGGWYLIASPIGNVAPTNVAIEGIDNANMVSGTFDLFYFDHTKDNEWVNYKRNESGEGNASTDPGFNLISGKGYLYANSEDVTLVFTGTAPTDEEVEVTLDYETSAEMPGWNLVGNPFAVPAYFSTERDFYTMNSTGTSFELCTDEERSIEPMQGVFVIAGSNEGSLSFTTSNPNTQGKGIVLKLKGRSNTDAAIVRFGEGRTLPKLQLFEGSTKIYIPQDGKEYAVVRSEEMGAMPVNFKAEENGTYSLNVGGQNTEFAYLHLIDNMTGADVDLLQTPSYSFEAKTTDYESRFKLVFATGDNSNDDNFAFYSNGSFVINNEGNAELQVIDIMGRIMKSESINGCANVSVNGAAGVYMLRLVNGDNVKVQKVVVK